MTVAELIEKLAKLPQDAVVEVRDRSGDWYPVRDLEHISEIVSLDS